MSDADGFVVRFWGVRGTLPCPGPRTLRYGGNTACVEVRCGGQLLIFDAGTGLRQLGKDLVHRGDVVDSHLFLTHTHIDHIMGLPFFRPAYDARNQFRVWSGHLKPQNRRLDEVLATFMQPPLFPVPLDIMHACTAFQDFAAGEVLMPCAGVTLRTAGLNHPGGATGYRVEFDGHAVCYVTDTEHVPAEPDAAVLSLIRDADIVIYDATYTDDEFSSYIGWGHSTWQEGARLCEAAGAKQLVTFHHDPNHDDAVLDEIALAMERERPGSIVAREGLVLHVA